MAEFRWFNGNQGVSRYSQFGDFNFDQLRVDKIVGSYNFNAGPYAAQVMPWRYVATVEGGRIGQDSALVYTKGTITNLVFYNFDGEKLLRISNLDTPVTAFMGFEASNIDYATYGFLSAGGHRFVGSNDASGDESDVTGDDITTGSGDDVVKALGGDDYIRDLGGADDYRGGDGFDTVSYDEWYWSPEDAVQGIKANLKKGFVTGPDGTRDKLQGVEAVHGSFLDDTLKGNAKNNFFIGMQGDDKIDGGDGIDRISYRNDAGQGGTDGILVDLKAGTIRDGFGTVDKVKNVELVIGTDSDDVFWDDNGSSTFRGHVGRDVLRTGRGDDKLEGGEGPDVFVFHGNDFGFDKVLDFNKEEGDKLNVRLASSFDDLTIVDEGDNVIIRFAAGTIELSGFYIENPDQPIWAGDFLF